MNVLFFRPVDESGEEVFLTREQSELLVELTKTLLGYGAVTVSIPRWDGAVRLANPFGAIKSVSDAEIVNAEFRKTNPNIQLMTFEKFFEGATDVHFHRTD